MADSFTFWQHQGTSFSLLASESPNRTTLNTSSCTSNGLQLEGKLPYLPAACSVSLPLSTHGKLKVKTDEQHAHDCLTNWSREGQSELIALPSIIIKLQSRPEAGQEPQHLPLPTNTVTENVLLGATAETAGLQTEQR